MLFLFEHLPTKRKKMVSSAVGFLSAVYYSGSCCNNSSSLTLTRYKRRIEMPFFSYRGFLMSLLSTDQMLCQQAIAHAVFKITDFLRIYVWMNFILWQTVRSLCLNWTCLHLRVEYVQFMMTVAGQRHLNVTMIFWGDRYVNHPELPQRYLLSEKVCFNVCSGTTDAP